MRTSDRRSCISPNRRNSGATLQDPRYNIREMRGALAVGLIALILAGCAHKQRVQNLPSPPGQVRVGYSETGLASWYGNPYHGRRAANGEIYDMEQMTAAHRTLPFNTWVRVQNLENHRTAEVRITDRGPFVDGRVIDVSRAAAGQAGLERNSL